MSRARQWGTPHPPPPPPLLPTCQNQTGPPKSPRGRSLRAQRLSGKVTDALLTPRGLPGRAESLSPAPKGSQNGLQIDAFLRGPTLQKY